MIERPEELMGSFYLGAKYDLQKKEHTEELVHYDARDLTTHAVCVGMTGSGKTGLCVGLLEEAAMDKVPALIIDPKGDIAAIWNKVSVRKKKKIDGEQVELFHVDIVKETLINLQNNK